MAPLLDALPRVSDPNVLVGTGTADDAGVYRLRDDLALVQTVDFFTPIVDDPYDFERIAAANALSDLYAMGARPVTALNLVSWSLDGLGAEQLGEVLRGGCDVAAEAAAAVIGGHSIDDPEPKYGMAVTGVAHPDEVLSNAGGRPGDALALTKPLGSGAIATAAKKDLVDPAVVDEAVGVMAALNGKAADTARAVDAHALTDVTGYVGANRPCLCPELAGGAVVDFSSIRGRFSTSVPAARSLSPSKATGESLPALSRRPPGFPHGRAPRVAWPQTSAGAP